jgi:peptidylprolyl isomerase
MLRFAFAFGVGFAFTGQQSASAKAKYIPPYPPVETNSIVFLDVDVAAQSWFGGAQAKNMGRIEIELFDDTVPITTRNFRSLCKGDMGLTPDGKPLHFKNSPFHRIIPGFMAQGGDITLGNGRGGASIYGTRFKDESFKGKAGRHHAPGLLSCANAGPNTNGSQFFLTFVPCPWLDGRHVVFGQVIKGFEIVEEMEKYGSPGGSPSATLTVKDCGVLKETPTTPVRMGYGK